MKYRDMAELPIPLQPERITGCATTAASPERFTCFFTWRVTKAP